MFDKTKRNFKSTNNKFLGKEKNEGKNVINIFKLNLYQNNLTLEKIENDKNYIKSKSINLSSKRKTFIQNKHNKKSFKIKDKNEIEINNLYKIEKENSIDSNSDRKKSENNFKINNKKYSENNFDFNFNLEKQLDYNYYNNIYQTEFNLHTDFRPLPKRN